MADAPLRLGTRRSALALAQSRQTARALEAAHPGLRVELVPIVTAGDRAPGRLAEIGGKGLFTLELERGLAEGDLDLAVHSLKDLPAALPEGLVIAAFPPRADPRDVLVSEVASGLADLPPEAIVLTGSLRRRAQLLHRRPDLEVRDVRGNVDTRLRKWREQEAAAVVLAAAGLARLGLNEVPAHALDPDEFLPAPGQGILAVETRRDGPAAEICRSLDHLSSRRAALAERRIVEAFGGDCTLPLAAWATVDEATSGLRLTAMIASPDGVRRALGSSAGADPFAVADACVDAMRREGADEILAESRS